MATYTNFDIPFFADNVLQGLVNTLVPLNAFSTNVSPDAVQKGTNVLVPLIGNVTATTFNNSYAICGGSASVITVAINRHRIASIGQTDLTAATSSRANLASFGYQAGVGLAVAVLQDIWSLLTTANFAYASTVASTAFTISEILAAKKLLDANKAPVSPRAVILDSAPYNSLLGTSQFMWANIAGNPAGLRQGDVGNALGAATYMTNALPGTNSVMGFMAQSGAIAVAMRYLDPGVGSQYYIDARPVSDPDTGISYGLRHHYDPNTGTEYVNLECTYGYAAGLTNCARLFGRTD